MLESLDELRTFVRVVEEGSLSAAARSQGLSVNAVSRRLAQLEERLGVRLAERSTRRVVLTDEGRRFAARCRSILAEADDAEEELRPSTGQVRGTVRVAVHPTVVNEATLDEIARLLGEHAGLSVQLYARNSVVDPIAEGLDLVLSSGDVPFQGVVVRVLGELDWGLAAAKRYLRGHAPPKTPEELCKHECLRAVRTRNESQWVLRNARGQQSSVSVGGRFESDDTAILRAAVYAGVGIGFRPIGEIKREAARGTLVHILPGWLGTGSGVRVQLLSPPGRLRLSRVRMVAEILERAVASNG